MDTTGASLREIFSEAAEIGDPAARAAFLESACRGNLVVRARVERLLLADSRAGEFLRDRDDGRERSLEKIGDRIGRYRLRERIGRGGCGVVYLAEQEEPVRREVALKVIRLGMDTRSVVARFEAERQALALMDHPNIARVFDAGETETGRPFFVMELVRGVPITEYCEQNGLSFRQRLELFIHICQAVQHAHQKGIIHRDLKPSNILVAAQDGAPTPKVIDFGIAKATAPGLEEHAGLTSINQFIGTPAYMSPEQVGLGERDVDTRSDIYSLGVILYELVTGQPPFPVKNLTQAGLDEMRRIVREVDPIRPSAKLRQARSSADPRSKLFTVHSALSTDLDWIVMKCLEKDRTRRYETANALSTDISRHLDNETISARPPTALYRFQKIVRRNPRVAVLTALLFLALAAGLSGVLFMNGRLSSANRQKDLANTRLAANLRDFEWQKVEDLVNAGKRGDALALLSDFLRSNPRDAAAMMRIFSMLNSGNFGLPQAAPFQHGAGVNSVGVSADGLRVLTAADDGTARLWDLQSGRQIASLAHSGKVNSARFAADDRLVLTFCQDGSARLWDADGSKPAVEFPKAPNARVQPTLSRDGKLAALLDTEKSVQVWDLLARRRLGTPLAVPGRVTGAAFSRDPNLISVSGDDGTVGVWTVNDSHLAAAFTKAPRPAEKVEFSPDGRILAASGGLTVTLWDTQTWHELREFKAHDNQILMIAFTPDGQRLVTAAYDQGPRIWDVTSGHRVGEPIWAEQPHCYFQISPDGRSLATRSQSGVIRIWDAMTGQPISKPFEHESPVTSLAFTPDGRALLSCSQDGTAQAWDIQRPAPVKPIFMAEQRHSSACFTRDSRYVFGTDGAQVLKFDAATGSQSGSAIIHGNPIYRMKASADGRKLVTTTWDGSARVWDIRTGDPRTPLLQHRLRLLAVDFSPDSRLVATGSEDTTARIWDAESGEPKTPPLPHDADVLDVSFRSDSRALLSAGVDGSARLWSAEDGHPLWTQPIRHKGIIWTAKFDPEGRRIVTASADRSAMVWDAQSREPLIRPIRHERSVSGAKFSPDGLWVLTWSEDGTARVWNSHTGEPISQPMRHSGKVTAADMSGDGRRVVTGSEDGAVRLWDAASGHPLSEAVQNGRPILVVEFAPDGRRYLSFADQRALRVLDIIVPPGPAPAWFPDLVEAVAGKRLTASRDVEPVARGSLQPLRQRFSLSQDHDFYSRWAKWFLQERMNEPAPGFVP